MLVLGIQWQGKKAPGAPLETVAVDGGAAAPVEHVDDLFEQVLLWLGLARGRDLEHVQVDEIAASTGQRVSAFDLAQARPRLDPEVQQVDAKALDYRDAVAFDDRLRLESTSVMSGPRPR